MKKIKQSAENLSRLEQLEGNMGEQAKELMPPLLIDLASGLVGWWMGKTMKRASLLTGLAVYTAGRAHSLQMAMERERKRAGMVQAAEENKHALSGIFNRYTDVESKVYHGDSPLVAFGMGMILGGATNAASLNGTEKTGETFSDRAKRAWNEITGDLKYRLYLSKEQGGGAGAGENTAAENTAPPVGGTEDLQVFVPSRSGLEQFDMSGLDSLEQTVYEHANAFESGVGEIETGYPALQDAVTISGTDEDTVGEVFPALI